MYPEENNEEKDFEIIMGGETELNISEVGDIMNTLKPNTSVERKNIIIPVSKNKNQNNSDEASKNNEKQDEDEYEQETENE